MGRVIDRDNLLAEERREALAAFLVEQQDLLGISTVTVLNASGQELVHVKDPILGDLPTRDAEREPACGVAWPARRSPPSASWPAAT